MWSSTADACLYISATHGFSVASKRVIVVVVVSRHVIFIFLFIYLFFFLLLSTTENASFTVTFTLFRSRPRQPEAAERIYTLIFIIYL